MASETNEKKGEIKLRVSDVFKEDVGRGIIRVDPKVLSNLKLKEGDIIEVYNKHKDMRTAGWLFPGPQEDANSGLIRLESSLRRNLGASIGSWVTIKKIEAKPAKNITLASLGESIEIKDTSKLTKKLENCIITMGDILDIYIMGERYFLKILGFSPATEAIRIHPKTKIKISGKNIEQTIGLKIITVSDIISDSIQEPSLLSDSEFKVNDFITLKLEEDRTVIYVNERRFRICNYLLNIPVDQANNFDYINSIDEAAEKLDHSQHYKFRQSFKIDPATEFWGHCSNIQAWVENNYDTRLIHRNLSFPLLKKLSDLGDPTAKIVFIDEIIKRIKSGFEPVIMYLIEERFLDYLNEDELNFIQEDLGKFFRIFFNKRFVELSKKFDVDLKIENILKFLKNQKPNTQSYRINIFGDEGIGYRAFINSLDHEAFNEVKRITFKNMYFQKLYLDPDNKISVCNLLIYDSTGRDEFINPRLPLYKDALIILVIFDLTKVNSYYVASNWINNVRRYTPAPILLVGNKDMYNGDIFPKAQEIMEKLIQRPNLYYIESSFKTKEEIHDIYYSLFSLLLKHSKNS